MKLLNVYRSKPNDDTQKLVEIVSEGREVKNFDLYEENPDYGKLMDMVYDADQTICWW